MPGTLVQESSKNFFSIVKYLDLLEVNFDYINFINAIKEKTEDSLIWFSNFVWSNSIKNINDELNLPKPIFEIHWLSFSPIEKYFYQKTRKLYTIKISDIINKNNSALMKKLMDVDRNTKLDVVGDILTLLEACVVPLIHGKCMLKINGTFSLLDSLDNRIIKCRAECNELLNQCAKNLKKLAEVYMFVPDGDGKDFEKYIILLMDIISDTYKKQSLTIGTDYEIIELVYKFMSLLKENTSLGTKHPVYNISYFEKTIQNLESSILNVHSNNILQDQHMLQQKLAQTNSITEEINSLRHNDWWIDMLQCISSPSDFLTEVKTIIECNRKACIPNIVNQFRLKSISDINVTLTDWLTNIIITRNKVLSMYKTLDINSNGNNIKFGCTTAICTIRNQCLFCQFGCELCYYKKILINNNIENLDEDIMKNLTESNREQTISQHEILLRSLILCETNNSVTDDYIQIATKRMEILNVLSSEFLNLWKLWLSLDAYKMARQQLIKAKSTITIDEVLANIKNPRRSTKIKKMSDNIEITNFLRQYLSTLRPTILDYSNKFKTKYESLVYLKALPHIIKTSPIFCSCHGCDADINEHVILYCGHTICSKCLIQAYGNSNSIYLNCPKCRSSNLMENMECVKLYREFGDNLIGSYSIKLESIVSKLKKVIALDKCSKVIIFSSFEKSLDCLSSALRLNSIHFMRLNIGCFNSTTVLNNFQNSENITTILINYNIGLNNLKLNFATRVFFMEPIMDKSFENQIVDNIRSKQTKPTYVHHFIIKDSIEEKISNTFTNDDPSLGIDVTLGQLSELLISETDLQTD
ncbi:E3 ubiquitin-protein ligase SHPRH-like [Acyrthosiphon pisum]|uniref:RING-type domain-containing protein n=1 Tax=Acyrthosiphon pisum TaxID=7029 RepID=A0A8R2D2S9_ACYPI|nr:E3 ubiquitin-protein ligase SHPRH-like [Acyrthosiphon pisum]|eukprot:XP_016658766.1 PREDICTED: E3 ubiquitin-protein ligase SHPRH-like isoform X1 [Acyrthosiphon pisum]